MDNSNKKRKLYELCESDKSKIYKSGDIIIETEQKYFGYDMVKRTGAGGIFLRTFIDYYCQSCKLTISECVGHSCDYGSICLHIEKCHNVIAINSIEEDKANNRIKITYQKKVIL